MKTVSLDLPTELLELLGSEEAAKRDAKRALVFDLVRRGRVSRAKASELLGIPLVDFPALLADYGIPWFDYSAEDLEHDLESLKSSRQR